MSTNGSIVLVAEGTEHVLYNHSDSYPEWLGKRVLGWLRATLDRENGEGYARRAVALLRPTPDRDPTPEELVALAPYYQDVSTGKDWYAALRSTQGDLDATLQVGLYDASMADFPLESLFCEWAYVIDFDERMFEVYQGFQTSPPTEGRYVGRSGPEPIGHTGRTYYPVQRVRSWSFDELPEPALFNELEAQLTS